MPVFEGEDGAYEPVEMGLYKPYEVVWKFNAEDLPGSTCSSREPTSMSKLDAKTCIQMCGREGWSWNETQGCHPPTHQPDGQPAVWKTGCSGPSCWPCKEENGWLSPPPPGGGVWRCWNTPGLMRISKEDWIKSQTVTPQPTPGPTPQPGTPWYVQEVVPSVPNWLLVGAGIALIVGYFIFRKKEG